MRVRMVLAACLWLTVSLGCQGQDLSVINCGEGLSAPSCKVAVDSVRRALDQLNHPVDDWRWVVVPTNRWNSVSGSFEHKPSSPAFSVLDARVTYIEDVLVFSSGRIDEGLQAYSRRSGFDRLRWVVAHEAGHIVCRSSSEQIANAAAHRMEAGGKGLRESDSTCQVSR